MERQTKDRKSLVTMTEEEIHPCANSQETLRKNLPRRDKMIK